MILDRDTILKADDLKTITISVPEWGGDVLLCEMRAEEREKFERKMMSFQGGGSLEKTDPAKMSKALGMFRVELLSKCIVDEQRRPLFGPDDLSKLNQKSSQVISRLFMEALKLSGFSKEATGTALGESEMIPEDDS